MASDGPIKKSRAVPPPENTKAVSVRLYEADVELLRDLYPDGVSQPIRRVVRRLSDTLRKERGYTPKGQPGEKWKS